MLKMLSLENSENISGKNRYYVFKFISKQTYNYLYYILNKRPVIEKIDIRISIELSDRFELSDTIHFTSKNDQSMPGIHKNDVLRTYSLLILALKKTD